MNNVKKSAWHQAPRRAVCGTRGSLRTMHGGGSAPSCCVFTHRVASVICLQHHSLPPSPQSHPDSALSPLIRPHHPGPVQASNSPGWMLSPASSQASLPPTIPSSPERACPSSPAERPPLAPPDPWPKSPPLILEWRPQGGPLALSKLHRRLDSF